MTNMLWAGVGTLALGLSLVVWLVLQSVGSNRKVLSSQIDHFTGRQQSPMYDAHIAGVQERANLKESMVDAADKVLSADLEQRVGERLTGAGSSLVPAEWMLLHGGIAIGAGTVGLLMGGLGRALVFFVLGAIMPWLVLRFRHNRRRKAFNAQLADTLQLIAGGLSAGLSMPQAIETVVQEAAQPMAGELQKAMIEQRLGIDITDALDAMALRMGSQDAGWVVMAMRIQREVGGNLAELLMTVAATLRERDDIRRKVSVLASEGKMSAWVLGGLPVAMFFYMYMTKRDVLRPMYTEPLGFVMLGAGFMMLGIGGFWMSRMIKIEV